MHNKEIAEFFKLLANLLELHGENKFKARAYGNAAYKISKYPEPLSEMDEGDLSKIEGFGKGIISKIMELKETGNLEDLSVLAEKTPAGVIELMGIKGLGPGKIKQLWKELQIESPGQLLYACNENRLVDLKGFGKKTQDKVRKIVEYAIANKGKFHYAAVEPLAESLVQQVKHKGQTELVSLTGEARRKNTVIESIDILAATEEEIELSTLDKAPNIQINLKTCSPENFYFELFKQTGNENHITQLNLDNMEKAGSEEEIYSENNLPYIVPELRNGDFEFDWIKKHSCDELINYKDLKGVLHNHTTYSDGMNTLEEMAVFCKELGFEYLGICDHSKSAFYANGLDINRIKQQQEEIDLLNEKLKPFRIFKGIESDILNDGSLDYPDEVLESFDMIVASVHSNLNMDKTKATDRILRAVENPYTTILGHPTGRLLLSREGYPLDHKKIIDACSENNVIIELNAHPYRLDIDWKWIPYCMEKGVMISINPDAHQKKGYYDMQFGVYAGRKGGLTKNMTFNALTKSELELYLKKKAVTKEKN